MPLQAPDIELWDFDPLLDIVDTVKDSFPQNHYKEEEDPHNYVSKKTGRGPLTDDWMEKYRGDAPPQPIMCAYKLIRVEFKYWGMQVSCVFRLYLNIYLLG